MERVGEGAARTLIPSPAQISLVRYVYFKFLFNANVTLPSTMLLHGFFFVTLLLLILVYRGANTRGTEVNESRGFVQPTRHERAKANEIRRRLKNDKKKA